MRRTAVATLVAAAAVLGFGAAPAAAVAPQQIPLTEVHNPVQDQGQACGFPVLWDIRLTLEGWNFFDNEGNLVRQQLKIREDNTITNLDTGLTLREGPDSFMQTTIFNPDGTVAELIATGLAANVQGDEPLKDVGRVVWLPGTNEIVFSAGPHPVRENIEFGGFGDALRSFCDALS
ncbi:MAG TPA: hypothetical protein VFZ85_20630 [Jiangellaceae bacterium]